MPWKFKFETLDVTILNIKIILPVTKLNCYLIKVCHPLIFLLLSVVNDLCNGHNKYYP